MQISNCPLAFWDYCVERHARINNLTARDTVKLRGSNPHTTLTGEEGNISNLCQFGFYNWCYYHEQGEAFPYSKEILGRVLGPLKGEGNEMAQWILKANGNVVPWRSPRPLTMAELHSPTELKKREVFDKLIERRWGNAIIPSRLENVTKEWSEYEDDVEEPQMVLETEDVMDATGKQLNQNPAYDRNINSEVALQIDSEVKKGKVVRHAMGPDGKVTGTYDDNPILNTVLYDVEFADGQVREYAANVIAENMLTQVDSNGFTLTMMKGIVDFKMDPAVAIPKDEKYLITKSGQRQLRKTTSGWKLLVAWADDSETWVPLKDLKESHPVEVAEFAKAWGIADEAAFVWWVPYTLRKRDVILSKVKARIRKTTQKYGIEIPMSVENAYEIDTRNNNDLWRKAIDKEMTNVSVAFQVLEEGEKAPPGWSKASGHIVFDVKMGFTRKARWVLDGH